MKYNITQPKEKNAAYRTLVNPKLMDELKERNQLLDHRYEIVRYLLFSKSGFSDWILTHQKEEAIMPIDLMQMYTSH